MSVELIPTAVNSSVPVKKKSVGLLGWLKSVPTGLFFAAPIATYLIVFFAAPLVLIAGLAFMPSGSTGLNLYVQQSTLDAGAETSQGQEVTSQSATGESETSHVPTVEVFAPTLENFERVVEAGYFRPFYMSAYLALVSTAILLLICYPLAYGLAKVFGRAAPIWTMLFLMPLFVPETIRLYGWSLFFLKGGISNGICNLFGLPFAEMMYTTPVIVLGLVNIYMPFMLFPLVLGISLVDDNLVAAARDLGAGWVKSFLRIQLPLAMPGLVIGLMLTGVLTLGSMSETQVLGGQRVMMIAHSIDFAFTWQQDWPLGSALSLILIVATLVVTTWLLMRLDFDKLFGRK